MTCPGKVGQGLRFGDQESFIECADAASLNPSKALTVAVWANADGWGTCNLVSKDDWRESGCRGYVLRLLGDQFDFTGGWRFSGRLRKVRLENVP